jgi:hypothetical protein
MRAGGLASWLVLTSVTIGAQGPGAAEFLVLQRGAPIGRVTVSLDQSPDGWTLISTGRIGGNFNLHVKRFEAQYDTSWRPLFMSMELATPDDEALVHVAVMGTTTRTDIVRPGKEALFGANDIAPNTTFLPDYVFGALEALAARLERAAPGTTLPYFIVPRLETRARLERKQATTVTTTGGPRAAAHWWLMVERDPPTPIEVWVSEGRLVRLDLPAEALSVRRSDLIVSKMP